MPAIPLLKVVYDVRTAFFWRLYGDFGDQVFWSLMPLAVLGGALISSWRSGVRRDRLIACGATGVFAAIFCATVWWRYVATERLRNELAAGRAVVVTGRVTDFVAGNSGGHPPESFRLDTTHFEVSAFRGEAGYQLIQREGGVIHPGDSLRLSHVGGSIVRIETLP